jgi:hypothetical protein
MVEATAGKASKLRHGQMLILIPPPLDTFLSEPGFQPPHHVANRVKERFNGGAAGLRDVDVYQFGVSVYRHIDDSRLLPGFL